MIINLNPEFGCELALGIPYAYWLHQNGELDKVITSKGMKPFYYFCDNVEEKYRARTVNNKVGGLDSLPNNWIHHNAKAVLGEDLSKFSTEEIGKRVNGVLDYRNWTPPPYSKYYTNSESISDRPMIVVSNKIVMDHLQEPHGYFDIKILSEMFSYLTEKGYAVVYKRPKMNEFPIDENEFSTLNGGYTITAESNFGQIDDHELTRHYNDVHLIDEIVEQNTHYTFNETQLRIFANADGFISIAGGNGIFCSYFGKTNIIYVTTSGELRDNYFQENSYYRKLSGCNIIPVRDPETDIVERGYNDYDELLSKIKETY